MLSLALLNALGSVYRHTDYFVNEVPFLNPQEYDLSHICGVDYLSHKITVKAKKKGGLTSLPVSVFVPSILNITKRIFVTEVFPLCRLNIKVTTLDKEIQEMVWQIVENRVLHAIIVRKCVSMDNLKAYLDFLHESTQEGYELYLKGIEKGLDDKDKEIKTLKETEKTLEHSIEVYKQACNNLKVLCFRNSLSDEQTKLLNQFGLDIIIGNKGNVEKF